MTIETGRNGWVLWAANVAVLLILTLLSWNGKQICDDVDRQRQEIEQLRRESVRWQIVAEDVKEMKADVKRLLLRVQP